MKLTELLHIKEGQPFTIRNFQNDAVYVINACGYLDYFYDNNDYDTAILFNALSEIIMWPELINPCGRELSRFYKPNLNVSTKLGSREI